MYIYDMKVNHMIRPLGFAMDETVFSWKVGMGAAGNAADCSGSASALSESGMPAAGAAEGTRQTAARIVIYADETKTTVLRDTGWSAELDSLASRVDVALMPRTRYYWTVAVRTDAGTEVAGGLEWFETGKRDELWQGQWITCDSTEKRHPYFEKSMVFCGAGPETVAEDAAPATAQGVGTAAVNAGDGAGDRNSCTCSAQGKLVKARLYVCGLGLYEAFWNGQRIGDEYLMPYSNDYNQWVQAQTFDVTDLICGTEDQSGAEAAPAVSSVRGAQSAEDSDVRGEKCSPAMSAEQESGSCNVSESSSVQSGTLSILMGNGWYKARFSYKALKDIGYYGNEWKLIAELVLTYADGTEQVIGTDESWAVRRSNIIHSNIYDGESIDDTLPALATAQAQKTEAPKGRLMDRLSLPVTIHQEFEPVELILTPAGEQVFDMGQEFTGIFTLRVHEPAGTVIHIQTGEILQQGNFYRANLRTAKSEYWYTSNGEETVIRPHFTFYGYRYVKVEGVQNLKTEDFRGYAFYSEIEDRGSITTGHALVNQLLSNVRWGLRSNFVDVPTDCPQRDERMGWTGDAQVFSPTASYLTDSYAFYQKYLYDMYQEQLEHDGMVLDVIPSAGNVGTACVWGDASCIIPWNLYVFYGDKTILEHQYDSMKAWVEYIRRVDGDDHGWRRVFHYGDWLALDHPEMGPEQVLGATDEEFIANLYYAASAQILSKTAGILGCAEDEETYRKLSEEQFNVVKEEYYSRTGRCCIKTQTALILTLKYHLSENEQLAKEQLMKLFEQSRHKLKTGFVGTPLLCNVLSDNGYSDLAYELLLNEEYPGWLREIKLGATTVWERWNSLLDDGTISGTGMNSMNHYAYGSIAEWIFRHAAGLNVTEEGIGASEAPDAGAGCGTSTDGAEVCEAAETANDAVAVKAGEPGGGSGKSAGLGGRTMVIAPEVNWKLRSLDASYDSAAGLWKLSWTLPDVHHVQVKLTVPFGCCAKLVLPNYGKEISEGTLDGKPERGMETAADAGAVRLLAPGEYEFIYETDRPLKVIYDSNTPIGTLLTNPDVTKALSRFMDLNQVPNHMRGMSMREMSALYGGRMSEEQFAGLDAMLANL